MVDIVDAETRSRMMAGIKGKNTKPELALRRALHARGFRYRLHSKKSTEAGPRPPEAPRRRLCARVLLASA